MLVGLRLFCSDNAYRANAFTSTTVNADIGIDNRGIAAVADCGNGAFADASAAFDATFVDYMRHSVTPP